MSLSDILLAALIFGPWLVPVARLLRLSRRASKQWVSPSATPVQAEPTEARDQIWITPQQPSWLTRNRVP